MKNNIFFKNKIKKHKGSLLLEILIVVSIFVIILSIGVNAIFLGMQSNKVTSSYDMAVSLAGEGLEATRSIIEEDWSNIYNLNKNGEHYYLSLSGNQWVLLSGDEVINLNNEVYTRYITINNVSRNFSNRNIQDTYNNGDDDPSTQKVTVNITWPQGGSFSISEYFFRWKNKICDQSGWTTGGSGNTVINCTDSSYDTKDASVDLTGGTIKLQ